MKNIENELKSCGMALAKTEGISMNPMLYTGDTVVIVSPSFPLKAGDIPVYHRGDHLTMHRIIYVRKNGYIISGDNLDTIETDIKDKDIIGVLAGFYRNGQYIDGANEEYIRYAKEKCNEVYKKIFKYGIRKLKKFFRGD